MFDRKIAYVLRNLKVYDYYYRYLYREIVTVNDVTLTYVFLNFFKSPFNETNNDDLRS